MPLSLAPLALLLTLIVYPVDGYQESGIRRVERLRLRLAGSLEGPVPVEGARKSISDIRLQLAAPGQYFDDLPSPDPKLQRRIEALFADRDASYSVALLDITQGRPPRLAALRERRTYQPGSVGKLAIAAGLFTELSRLHPESIAPRRRLLRQRRIVADAWIRHDHHKVPLFDLETQQTGYRPIQEGDEFSLYEWVDHMLSASSNAAASTVWKEAMLMRAFGVDYPPSPEREEAFFRETSKGELRTLAFSIVNDPLRDLGIPEGEWKLGSFFTRTGKTRVPSGGSLGSAWGLLRFLVRLEQGRVVDAWSSLELKRLMYMTEKRIRYASAPRLRKSALYFKSGSLYKCRAEEGFDCGKFGGNVFNYMNSVAIVEKPEGSVYLVALMSNVLRVNSAVEHQTLATFIDRILTKEGR